MSLRRKDRFKYRKYFNQLPMNREQAYILAHYTFVAYSSSFPDFDAFNRLIYRVAKDLRIFPPSKISASLLVEWIYIKTLRRASRNECRAFEEAEKG